MQGRSLTRTTRALAVLSISAAAFAVVAPAQDATPTPAAQKPQDAAAALRSANGLLSRGLYDLAAAEYRSALKQDLSADAKTTAEYGLAVCLQRTQHTADAVKLLERVADHEGFTFAPDALALLAQCRLALDQPKPAADAARMFLQRFDDHRLAQAVSAVLVDALQRLKDPAETRQAAHRYLERWADSSDAPRIAYIEASSALAQGDVGVAADLYSALAARSPRDEWARRAVLLAAQCHHAAGDAATAERWYAETIAANDPNALPDALIGLATLKETKGDVPAADVALDRFLVVAPKHSRADEARLRRAQHAVQAGDTPLARRLLEQISDEHNPAERAYWLARCDLLQKRPADAAERLSAALSASPRASLAVSIRLDRAAALLQLNRADEAITCLAPLNDADLSPAQRVARLRLAASATHQAGRFAEARAHCRAFLTQFTNDPAALEIARLDADIAWQLADYAATRDALVALLPRLTDDREKAMLQQRLGLCLTKLNDDVGAAKAFEAAADADGAGFGVARLALARRAFDANDWQTAARLFERVLVDARAAQSPIADVIDEALLKLARSQRMLGDDRAALASLERLADAAPDSPLLPQAAFERGLALRALDRSTEAAEAFSDALERKPAPALAAAALLNLAALAEADGDAAKAAVLYDRAAQAAPEQAATHDAEYRRIAALARAEDWPTLITAAAAQLAAPARSDDHAAATRALLGLALLKMNAQQTPAGEPLDDFLQRVSSADLPRVDAALATSLRYARARHLRSNGDQDRARSAYADLFASTPPDDVAAAARLEWAALESNAERFAAALEQLDQLEILLPQLPAEAARPLRRQLHYRRGACLVRLEKWSEAADSLEAFLKESGRADAAASDPALLASAAQLAGDARLRAGDADQAATLLAQAATRLPPGPQHAATLLRLADAHVALQRWARSEAVCREYLERYADAPKAEQARFALGWSLENQQRYDAAIEAYHEITKASKTVLAARAQFQIGECRFAQRSFEDAARELLKVDILYQAPEWSAAAVFEAGRAFEQLGQLARARDQYQAVQHKYANSKWAPLAAERLKALHAAAPPGR